MANKITEKYFSADFNLAGRESEITAAIENKTGFKAEREIFRGRIYDQNKVGSLIYQGHWRGRPAVLKIQGLKPEEEEIDIIKAFNAQNKSKKIRLPEIYAASRWQKRRGYGYLILELVTAPQVYKSPFANPDQRKEFCALYNEYKTKCLNRPFVAKDLSADSSLVLTVRRVSHWLRIGESKGYLTSVDMRMLEQFYVAAAKHLPRIKTEFMHGHFTYDDIFKVSRNEYILMSNLFWSWRPEYYDAAFHLWAAIKSIRDPSITLGRIKRYLAAWLAEYKKLPVISRDDDFERKFNMVMLERCIGAILVDIENQAYQLARRSECVHHLKEIFRGLFAYYHQKLI